MKLISTMGKPKKHVAHQMWATNAQLLQLIIIACTLLVAGCAPTPKGQAGHDVVVYGGTSSGIVAAIQAARMGKSVALVVPTNRIGGLTTSGLGQTDIGNKRVIGGIAREFYENIMQHYQQPNNWKWQNKSEYKPKKNNRSAAGEKTMWTFEPSAALQVLNDMMAQEQITVIKGERLNRQTGLKKTAGKITAITMESGKTFIGKVFIDATYEGDLMAAAGVAYTVGREAAQTYGESLNGTQAGLYGTTLGGDSCKNAVNHNFVAGVDPYITKGDPSSGTLPTITPNAPTQIGAGDDRIQAYCFRMCLTDHPENRIPFAKPKYYNEADYELLFRNYEAGYADIPWINSKMPNRKTDTNNKHGFSTDFIGQNYGYPEASYEQRAAIVAAHRTYQQGLMWTLANHSRIPEHVRQKVSQWGTCKDEFESSDGWQQQLYIREARRMVGQLVMAQQHCEGLATAPKSIGMAAYGMDSHHTQRYIDQNGHVKNEGNVQAHLHTPYPIGYDALVPKKAQCTNLLVPVCLSASHIAFGSIRMEPVFMVLGQSAATAACLAIDEKVAVQDLDYNLLRPVLTNGGQILSDPIKNTVH